MTPQEAEDIERCLDPARRPHADEVRTLLNIIRVAIKAYPDIFLPNILDTVGNAWREIEQERKFKKP
jgi:hypothetical protein